MNRSIYRLSVIFLSINMLAACASLSTPAQDPSLTPFQPVGNTATPSQTPVPSATATPVTPTSTLTPTATLTPTLPPVPAVWADEAVPDGLRERLQREGWQWVDDPQKAWVRVEMDEGSIEWVYALAAPFSTVTDEVSLDELKGAWAGQGSAAFANKPLLVSPSTLALFSRLWGAPADGAVSVAGDDELLERAWADQPAWAIVPFEQLEPRWKVLRVDGQSPYSKEFDPAAYPLTARFALRGETARLEQFAAAGGGTTLTNRDPQRMTVVLLTGTTALVRATGDKMESLGMTYPAQDIRDWLLEPDFTHVSNEVSFISTCPNADPLQKNLMFCSRPEYIELLDYIDVDLVELSGNHNNDWGRTAFSNSLDMYRERGWQWFAGGSNYEEARQALKIEHNGNKLAFIGCNWAGPPSVWATNDEPGAAQCDYEWLEAELPNLRAEGYIPVFTFQHTEVYIPKGSDMQRRDFTRMAEAGATIVSGSQAHFPQGFKFTNNAYIHYGLGNLFFDQMDTPVDGTRREFLDRHIFYDGRYIGTELLTAMLEDYARPRPMTEAERAEFLAYIFEASDW
ncbi:MAG: CapA family protein [Anaerolineaceae bacterium]|nr:CapA family protein [Anaerolineaceae bacterium]